MEATEERKVALLSELIHQLMVFNCFKWRLKNIEIPKIKDNLTIQS